MYRIRSPDEGHKEISGGGIDEGTGQETAKDT